MKYSFVSAALIAASTVSAGPIVSKRQASAITDVQILNYALTLEHLEDTFYRQGLANYTQAQFAAAGFDATFYANLQTISSDEKTHVAFLTTALGSAAVAECVYSFPSTDVASFVGLASVFEGVGVSAYLGAAASIMNKDYLTAAGSILTVEARHSSYIRASLKESPFPQPFDVPLDFDEVYSLVAPFIKSCPSTNAPLPVKAFPALSLATTGTVKAGSTITLSTGNTVFQSSTQLYVAFLTVTGPIYVAATAVTSTSYTITIPAGVNGQSYAVLVPCNTGVSDDNILAGPAIIEITN